MSIQSEINRITNEVDTQESLILQIQEALKDTTIVKGGTMCSLCKHRSLSCNGRRDYYSNRLIIEGEK